MRPIDQLAAYFSTTPTTIVLWIIAGAIVVIWAIGRACIELSMTPEPEDHKRPEVKR